MFVSIKSFSCKMIHSMQKIQALNNSYFRAKTKRMEMNRIGQLKIGSESDTIRSSWKTTRSNWKVGEDYKNF